MGTGFTVDVGELRVHAAAVGTVADQVSAAHTTAQASVGSGAFGQIGEFFAGAIDGAGAEVRAALAAGARSVTDVRTGLRATADVYQETDQAHARQFNPTGNVVQAGVTKVGILDDLGWTRQRDKAIVVLTKIANKHPVSVARFTLPSVLGLRLTLGNYAAAKVGDFFEKNAGLMATKPTDANLWEAARLETEFWNSGQGNSVGSAISAEQRYAIVKGTRDAWLALQSPQERARLEKELGLN